MIQDVEVVDAEHIALCRRIKEILDYMKHKKGEAFSSRAFAKRIGMGKDTFRDTINGQRFARPSEQEKIAKGFGMSIERMKGTDTKKQMEEFRSLISRCVDLKRAIQLGLDMLPKAVGYSERFEILNKLGIAYQYTKEYEKAEKVWLQGLEIAKEIEKKYGEREPLFRASTNVLLVYDALKNFKTLRQLLDSTNESLDKLHPRYAGTLCYSLGEVALSVGDMSDYRRRTYDSLHYFQLTEDKIDIGMAEFRVGEAEFKLGNFSLARDYAALSMENLAGYEDIRYFPVKNYAKALLKLGEVESAVSLVEKSIHELSELNQPTLLAKFHLLHAIATKDVQSAERVLQYNDSEGILHFLACELLMSHYSKVGDSTNLMKYYRLREVVKHSPSTNWEVI